MKWFCCLLLFFITRTATAQQSVSDSLFYSSSLHFVRQAYKKEVQENLHLFNGIEYLRTSHGVNGTAFFIAESLLPGSVFYDGKLYNDVPLHYDIVSDDVVINNFAQNNEIKLVPEKVLYFSVQDHFFVRITADSTMPAFIKTGFYEQLYNGKMTVLAHHEKSPRISGASAENNPRYNEYNYYYVLLNGVFYKASDKSDFVSLAGDQKDAVKKFIKTNRLNFKKNKEAAMVSTAAYYSQLTH